MTTECFALVRGSGLRVTGLDMRGALPNPVPYATSRSVSKVELTEVSEGGKNEVLRNDDDDIRIYLPAPAESIKYTCDIDFLNCDPGIIELMTGNPAVRDASLNYVGFDAKTRLPVKSFALEIWSRLPGQVCADGQRKYGYTLFPWIKGGYISGLKFGNNLVTFSLRGAQVIRGGRWEYGPYDLTGVGQKLDSPVSRNTLFRQVVIPAAPPLPSCGIQEYLDIIDGGGASSNPGDVLDGGSPGFTSDGVVDGGSPSFSSPGTVDGGTPYPAVDSIDGGDPMSSSGDIVDGGTPWSSGDGILDGGASGNSDNDIIDGGDADDTTSDIINGGSAA